MIICHSVSATGERAVLVGRTDSGLLHKVGCDSRSRHGSHKQTLRQVVENGIQETMGSI